MGLNNVVRSRGFKNFMSKLYGIGASIVILGALFKINHYPGADIMLIIGLGTEAIIFFFSAFEPPYVEPDWSLVYPELAGMYSEKDKKKKAQRKPTEELDDMLKKANIDSNMIERFGKGLENFSLTASKMSDIGNATVATTEYVENVKAASSSVGELNQSYKKTSDILNRDAGASEEYANSIKSASEGANGLSSAYREATEAIRNDISSTNEFAGTIQDATASAKSMAENYNKSAELLARSVESLDFTSNESKAYNEQLKRISDNLAALNSVYELQLQGTNQQVESAAQLQETMNEFLSNLNNSADKTLQYQEQLDKLTERIGALNRVYGNMLSAMGGSNTANQ